MNQEPEPPRPRFVLLRTLFAGFGLATARRAGRDPEFAQTLRTVEEAPPWLPPMYAGEPVRVPLPTRRELFIALGLLLLTAGTTTLAGGAVYAATLLAILLCHEFGHYLMCRRYRVRASLPLFIPFPPVLPIPGVGLAQVSPFGTMGALILMRASIRNRRVLYDIGIAGPLAGAVPALVALAWGLAHSTLIDLDEFQGAGIRFGDSLIVKAMTHLYFPQITAHQDVVLHPVAFAGWAGLFVTALNLLPVGQLDGGHILYGLLGSRAVRVSVLVLVALGLTAIWYPGWWVWLVLLFVIGYRHPRTIDEDAPIGAARVALGILALILFVLCFVPRPISFTEP